MKLVTFAKENRTYVGALIGRKVINLNSVLKDDQLSMKKLIDQGLENIQIINEEISGINLDQKNDSVLDLEEISLKAPLSNPGKVVCMGNNYMDHCREQNVEPPMNPMIFSKWPSCIVGPEEEILLPLESQQVDYEAELGVVFSKEGKNITEEEAYNHIFGYVILNDISARDVQFADGQWVRGKSYDTFAPCGPYLVTADEVEDPQNLSIRLSVNDEILQDSNTKEMIFNIKETISYLSKGFTFYPGDLLATGTPHGVGVFREPQIFLQHGDEVSIEIEGLGILKNYCVREKETSTINMNYMKARG